MILRIAKVTYKHKNFFESFLQIPSPDLKKMKNDVYLKVTISTEDGFYFSIFAKILDCQRQLKLFLISPILLPSLPHPLLHDNAETVRRGFAGYIKTKFTSFFGLTLN